MTAAKYKINLEALTASQTFSEASAEELRVLFALESLLGDASLDKLSAVAAVSRARVAAALALFEDAGVIEKDTDEGVSYEFAEQRGLFDPTATGSSEVARDIRDNSLANMISECTRIMKRVTLPTSDIAAISALYTELGLSPEYILTLSAFLKTRKQILTVEAIVREANKLIEKGLDTLEELELYVAEKEKEIAGEMEMRRLFGIYGRTLTKSEREHFNRWMHEYGYSSVIIGEAYDVTVAAINKISLPYINTILAGWHDAGCKTLEECRAKINTRKHENDKKANNSSHKSKKTVEADVPKYADFNSEDALMRAIERSYGASDETK